MAEEQMQVDFTQLVNEIANRLRILESKQGLLSEKMLVMNQNMVEEYKKTLKEIKAIDADFKAVKMDLENVKNIVRHFSEEASKFAKQNDVKVLEKYIKLWDPLKFVTEKEVRDIIKDELKHKKEDKKHGHTSE
ncbi:hypothetical protein J4223_02310 [Candidatus Woesearchaeota archaeon]|nr:hypothetical protein [Candidatus Woesearchaeota archaeon]